MTQRQYINRKTNILDNEYKIEHHNVKFCSLKHTIKKKYH